MCDDAERVYMFHRYLVLKKQCGFAGIYNCQKLIFGEMFRIFWFKVNKLQLATVTFVIFDSEEKALVGSLSILAPRGHVHWEDFPLLGGEISIIILEF